VSSFSIFLMTKAEFTFRKVAILYLRRRTKSKTAVLYVASRHCQKTCEQLQPGQPRVRLLELKILTACQKKKRPEINSVITRLTKTYHFLPMPCHLTLRRQTINYMNYTNYLNYINYMKYLNYFTCEEKSRDID
jgi:hypothetical protein